MRVLCFDSETTDLVQNGLMPLSKQPHIIEWAGILADVADDGTITEVERLAQLVSPGFMVTPSTTEMTGISNAMLDGAPTWAQCCNDITRLLDKAEGYVGHNLMFDVQVTSIEMQRMQPDWHFDWNKNMFCTVELHEYPLGRRYKLGDLHALYFGSAHLSAHRAMPDVEATLKCFGKAVEKGYV